MLSPVKLYKADMKTARRPVTWGPKGRPAAGCSGSLCYRHKNVDWTVHRLVPAIHDRAKPNSIRRKVTAKGLDQIGTPYRNVHSAGLYLRMQSPRWGDRVAPGRMQGSRRIPLPKKGTIEVSTKSKVALGATVAAAGAGYYGYKHRDEIKARAQHINQSFHNSRLYHKM